MATAAVGGCGSVFSLLGSYPWGGTGPHPSTFASELQPASQRVTCDLPQKRDSRTWVDKHLLSAAGPSQLSSERASGDALTVVHGGSAAWPAMSTPPNSRSLALMTWWSPPPQPAHGGNGSVPFLLNNRQDFTGVDLSSEMQIPFLSGPLITHTF